MTVPFPHNLKYNCTIKQKSVSSLVNANVYPESLPWRNVECDLWTLPGLENSRHNYSVLLSRTYYTCTYKDLKHMYSICITAHSGAHT